MNILVIRTHRFGDVLQLTPMLRGLKIKYPAGKITFLTGSSMLELLSGNPDIDEVIAIPEEEYRWNLKNKPGCYARIFNELYDLVFELKQKKYQLIINRQYEFGAIIAWLAAAEKVYGGSYLPASGYVFEDDVSKALFETIQTDRSANDRNLVDWACQIAALVPGCGKMTFCVPQLDRLAAKDLLISNDFRQGRPLVALQMGAARSFRQWGVENYSHIIRWLVKNQEKSVVLLGSEDEKDLAAAVRDNLGALNKRVINLIGKTSFSTLGGVLEQCQCLITGDTGTMHMAAAVETPVVSLFYGTAYPWETGPYGTGHLVLFADEPCAPCLDPQRCVYGYKCRNAITPEHVRNAFEIGEKMRKKCSPPFTWPTGSVKLFITHVRSGYGQTLIPINSSAKMVDEICFFIDSSQAKSVNDMPIDNTGSILKKQTEAVIRMYYRGDRQSFLDTFSNYIVQWEKCLRYYNGNGGIEYRLSQSLVFAINEACRALETNDFATVADLVQYKFSPMMKRLKIY